MSWWREPAATLRHPVVLAALVMWALNDHVLKAAHPGWLTGKVSDVCGLVVVPALVVSAAALVARPGRDPAPGTTRAAAAAAAVVIGVVFAMVQVWAPAGELYRVGFGYARWPLDAVVAVLGGGQVGAPGPVRLWPDATDLVVLPVLAVPVLLGSEATRRRRLAPALAPAPASAEAG